MQTEQTQMELLVQMIRLQTSLHTCVSGACHERGRLVDVGGDVLVE